MTYHPEIGFERTANLVQNGYDIAFLRVLLYLLSIGEAEIAKAIATRFECLELLDVMGKQDDKPEDSDA